MGEANDKQQSMTDAHTLLEGLPPNVPFPERTIVPPTPAQKPEMKDFAELVGLNPQEVADNFSDRQIAKINRLRLELEQAKNEQFDKTSEPARQRYYTKIDTIRKEFKQLAASLGTFHAEILYRLTEFE